MPGDSGPAYRRFQNLPKGVCPSCKYFQLEKTPPLLYPQKESGCNVLPFRVIAEAFGAEVDYGPKDGPVEWVTFKQ
ncbi:MAG: hypothetical protein AB1796_04310 [Bacillota bacterium]